MLFHITTGNRVDSSRRSINGLLFIFAVLSLTTAQPASAQEFSGFLDDYTSMEEVTPGVFIATIPDAEARVSKYDAIMIDQPEFLLADDSKYSRLKPDEIKLIADTLRQAFMKSFERSSYRLVATAGPTTLYLRTGITEVGLKKKRKRLIQFTPIGLAATLVTSPLRDVMDKLELQRFDIEAELLDSVTEERVARFVDRSREAKADESWDSILGDFNVASSRTACRLENARLAADARTDCIAAYPFTD